MNQKFKQMAEVMSGIDIKQVLKQLGIKSEINKGASTGVNWLDTTGEEIKSFTPVDGSVIGTVRLASKEDYDKKGTLIKWNPAVKNASDRSAIWNAVLDNRIDVIATDHAPHTIE
jgi:hypothetical protein